ncbi:hypothetical protein CAPTEDRAFT_205440 [Capitella teleta]|uniref:Uncharacterized protein n=1 Tax=Capitella teleta TaxID=283909 RepID=R7TUP2_CAPTE|nr:hypothetical protein CAPTEDRAFT_205440 [Capitella teleta]|eukprot:ELT97399.1 hypothetical protein CAPTEDRAFT_205440 [Capitella teleta]
MSEYLSNRWGGEGGSYPSDCEPGNREVIGTRERTREADAVVRGVNVRVLFHAMKLTTLTRVMRMGRDQHCTISLYPVSWSIPHSSVSRSGSRRSVPFWSTHLRPLKDNALFWHAIWKSCDSPATGAVANIQRSTRAKYHRAIRYFKQNDQLARFTRMGEHFVNQERDDFWTEVKKMRGNNSATPTIVNDCLSEDDIALCFREKYNTLYNSVGYMPEEMARLRQEIEANACRHEGEMCRFHVLSTRDVTIASAMRLMLKFSYCAATSGSFGLWKEAITVWCGAAFSWFRTAVALLLAARSLSCVTSLRNPVIILWKVFVIQLYSSKSATITKK